LPAGAPKISTMLLNAANQIPAGVPNFPMAVPDLPAVPALPAMPGQTAAGLTKYVTAVEVVPVRSTVTPLVQSYTQPIEGVVGQVSSRRGM
jgi:hypothetical protein